ncbi:oxygenase MpaB family protein [Actinokineospora auranticolor]|uniref:Uncharacterized protein DUF2236 n=1 Tax=Actinokineospora auranticolor TaxID=155976 RepID=A0A2S6GMV6_9PSEU|nr:oxygenase MpaB family protein [Actinokineospora auranticolor]PPK66547.1 uncharacterized protein DUF2236 [Actinokineospora auranticolor]
MRRVVRTGSRFLGRLDESRLTHLATIRGLDPVADNAAIHRLTTLFEFPFEWQVSLQLAFFRTYGVPSIGGLLGRTGHIVADPVARAEDTGLMIAEMVEHGLDDPRARHVLRSMNKMHRRWEISNDDYVYVLGSLLIVPLRHIERYGWRPLDPAEREAAYHFWREVGEHMAIKEIPGSLAEFEDWFDAYEAEHFAPTPAAARLIGASSQLIVDRFPSWAAPLARQMLPSLMDPPMRRALGVATPPRLAAFAVRRGLRLRARVVATMSPRAESSFTPGGEMKSHPTGYKLEDLGARPSAEATVGE